VPQRALLLVNRKSRQGATSIDNAVARLKNRGIDVIEGAPDTPEQIPELIRRHAKEADCVIVGGGDGSMNAAASALAETGLPLGVLPMGTANDLARTLSIPLDILQACDVIADGVTHRIDLGEVNGRYFFNVANIGLGAHVARHLSSGLKQRWGILSYARSLIKAVRSFRPFHAEIVCDGERRRVKTMQIAVGNGRHYGGGMTIAEQASIDDRQFCLYSIDPLPFLSLLRLARVFRTGQFEDWHPVYVRQGKHIEIHTRRAMAVTADGEFVSRTPAIFSLVPGAVQVYVPASYFEDKQEISNAAQKQSATGT
jgi:YegS/Rv2252/BmrU family lipid kinase